MTAIVVRGDARCLPLPDASVDLIVTSPPYYALRSYTDGGAHYTGQIGSEATSGEYLAALWACTAEWARVLKPQGSLWINLGDTYSRGDRTVRAPRNYGGASHGLPLASPIFDIPGKRAARVSHAAITGYVCACPEPTARTRPAVVLDPFGGTGTTALVAHALGRIGISIDMSGDYSRLAHWRCTDRRELAKAMRVPKPEPVGDGQLDLLAGTS